MIHVVLDTSIYRRNPRLDSKEFTLLQGISATEQVTLHAETGYRNIAGKFRTVDDYGTVCVRRFVDGSPLLSQRTPDQWQQDAFGQVDARLLRLGLR